VDFLSVFALATLGFLALGFSAFAAASEGACVEVSAEASSAFSTFALVALLRGARFGFGFS